MGTGFCPSRILTACKGESDIYSFYGGGPPLHRPIALLDSEGIPARSIVLSSPLKTASKVIADDLLDEVFVNVLSNAVKYASGAQVPVDITLGVVGGPVRLMRARLAEEGGVLRSQPPTSAGGYRM